MTERNNSLPNGAFLKLINASEDHGYKIMTERLRSGKHALKQIMEAFSLRATMEEEFGKKLSKAAKLLENNEYGSLHSAVQTFHTQTERMAQLHLEFANLLKATIEKPTADLLAKQKIARDHHLSLTEKNIKTRASANQLQLRAQAKYAVKCHELNVLREQKDSKSGKDYEKIVNKYAKADNSAKVLEVEFKLAEAQSYQAQLTWEREWINSLGVFEELEIERTQFLTSKLKEFCSFSKHYAEKQIEAYDQIHDKVSQVDITSDLEVSVKRYLPVETPENETVPAPSSSSDLTELSTSNVLGASSSERAPSSLPPQLSLQAHTTLTSDLMPQPPLPPRGSVLSEAYAVALYSYDAKLDEELSFCEGQEFKVLETTESGWWRVELLPIPSFSDAATAPVKTVGLAPSNFLKLNAQAQVISSDDQACALTEVAPVEEVEQTQNEEKSIREEATSEDGDSSEDEKEN